MRVFQVLFVTVLFAAGFLVLSYASNAVNPAENIIGLVMEVEGNVGRTAQGGYQQTSLIKDDKILLNDTIITGAESKVLILFVDDTEITLGENTTLTIDEYVFDTSEDGSTKGDFSILKGTFLFVSGLITKSNDSDVNIQTAYGSVGLRGTQVWGGQLDNEYGILVQEGAVDVTNSSGRTRLNTGEGGFFASKTQAPRRVSEVAPEVTERVKKRVAMANKEAVRSRVIEQKQKNVERRQLRKQAFLKGRQEQLEKLEEQKMQLQEQKEKIEEKQEELLDLKDETKDKKGKPKQPALFK